MYLTPDFTEVAYRAMSSLEMHETLDFPTSGVELWTRAHTALAAWTEKIGRWEANAFLRDQIMESMGTAADDPELQRARDMQLVLEMTMFHSRGRLPLCRNPEERLMFDDTMVNIASCVEARCMNVVTAQITRETDTRGGAQRAGGKP